LSGMLYRIVSPYDFVCTGRARLTSVYIFSKSGPS
jgi:hypothetical protein